MIQLEKTDIKADTKTSLGCYLETNKKKSMHAGKKTVRNKLFTIEKSDSKIFVTILHRHIYDFRRKKI